MNIYSQDSGPHKIISFWLGLMCALIVLMIFIGGVTRLTKSGLSITEWNPISGILPPLNEEQWNIEFDKYKNSPEYQKINYGLSFSEFKSIYLVEFIHRIVGRIAGLVFVIPLVIFFIKGYIKAREMSVYLLGTVLFLGQGLMGWYMVKSGLVHNPHVSHYRLAAHLFLAILLYILFLWQYLKSGEHMMMLLPTSTDVSKQKKWCLLSISVLLVQIVFGAFVAGLEAGHVYNEFPLMGGDFIPHDIKSDISLISFNEPVFIQFVHRITAYVLSIIIIIFCIKSRKIDNKQFSLMTCYILIFLVIQILVGVLTLLYNVPISLALLHQLGAILLLTSLVRAYFLLENS